MNEPDHSLLDRIALGDENAFEQIYLRYFPQVYRSLYGLLGRHEEVEDLAQETFLELYRHAGSVSPHAPVLAWLCRVALNKGYNSLRGEKRARQRMERFAASQSGDPYADLLRAEDRARVREVLVRLSERDSRLLLLRYAGLSLAEIAAVLGVAPGSVGTMLTRAERAFATAYESMHPAEPAEPQDLLKKRKL